MTKEAGTGWKTWGDVYRHYRRKGHDHSDCAYRADEWEARQSRRE